MRRVLEGMLLSALLHAGLFGAALGTIAWVASHGGPMSIDLTASSLLFRPPRPASAGHALPRHVQVQWTLGAKGRPAPLPTPPPQGVTVTAEEEMAGPPCPPPCPENPGEWTPEGDLSHKPAWADGLIGEEDYPTEMRRQRRQGLVVADVLIDASGAVRGVSLVKGSEGAFNQLVLDRLAHSIFTPARDRSGHVVPCRARIPVDFRLD